MVNQKANYMGLELRSPVIVGANNLVKNTDNLKKIEDAGAGAIVYKSLFEEQVMLENLELSERKTEYNERHAESVTVFPEVITDGSEIEEHLIALRKANETVSIPVFGSLNAVYDESWVEYAKKLEETGIAGLELNFYTVPEKFDTGSEAIETRQVNTLKAVREAVKIPIAVKLSPFYSNPLKLIADLDKAGANAFVLFNRLFQPDIDVETEEPHFPYNLSHREDNRLPLRFSGLLYGNINASICASSGILSGTDVIKMILAGADTVQVVSALYLSQIDVISRMLNETEAWMESKDYDALDDFRGKLSRKRSGDKLPYHRAQYMDFVMTTSEILKKYRVVG
ncbi:MAG TPA: dihydroorotate dehydrogenase-like protein [Bacteroidales bacterium]|jgi:dihydroorotate dehydrogenase (fumarate)|nr:dihydroorotate dehydrogenase-like protein [Bacteroidales bacterium]